MHCFLKKTIIILAVLLMLLISVSTASADMGPKSSMDYEFIFDSDKPLSITNAHFFECKDPDCMESREPTNTWPEFSCTLNECYSGDFGFGDYFKLIITFSDGITRESNAYEKRHFNAKYSVTVYPDRLYVEENLVNLGSVETFLLTCCNVIGLILGLSVIINLLPLQTKFEISSIISSLRWSTTIWIFGGGFLLWGMVIHFFTDVNILSLPLTVLVEGVLVFAYYAYRKEPRALPTSLNFFGNLLTQSVLLLIIFKFGAGNSYWLFIIFAETVIVVAEALIFYLPQRRQISFQYALGLSFFLNLASFTIGLFLPV